MKIVVSYRGIPQARGYAFGACLARAFRRLGHEVFEYGTYYQTAEPLSPVPLPAQADALIYCECNDTDRQYTELRTLDAPIKAYWDFDVDNRPGRTLSFVRQMNFTHVFYANRRYGALFSCVCPKIAYLPIAFDEELFRPLPEIAKSVDVGLCGTAYPGRVALIERLTQSGLSARLVTGVYGDRYVETINSFRMHLNYEVGGGRGLMPARIWETLGCRTLLLAERADFIELFFRDMQEVVLYSTPEECVEKIKLLLQQPSLIEEIAGRGYECAVAGHSYLRRAEAMLAAFDSPASMSGPSAKPRPSAADYLRVGFLILRHRVRAGLRVVKASLLSR